MLIVEMKNVKKSFGERLVIDIESFRLYDGEHVGIVGSNGAGKTTFLEILSGELPPDSGSFRVSGSWEYIRQLSEFEAYKSGGEKTLEQINNALSRNVHLLMADEPTSSLSIARRARLREQLMAYKGGLLLISHDRELLNSVCGRIIEIENGKVKEYSGNYDFYRSAKELETRNQWENYETYVREKRRIKGSTDAAKRKADSMTKAPRRMGNSEARLHRGGIKDRAGRVERIGTVLEKRLNRLETVAKPREVKQTKIDLREGTRLYSKVAIEVIGASKAFGKRELFSDASFKIENGSKTVLTGENGSGKTTLLRMITEDEPCVKKAAGLKTAYFSQDLSILDENRDIYSNAAMDSAMSQGEIRGILARMLFRGDDVFKPVKVLSGGERVKAALCKLFCRDVNMLILDEPNNYLDIQGIEALEGLIRDYRGTVLFVSHDRRLIELADHLLIIKDRRVISWVGSYAEYTEKKQNPGKRLMLENRIAALLGEISERSRRNEDTSALDKEFARLSRELRGE